MKTDPLIVSESISFIISASQELVPSADPARAASPEVR